MSLKLNSSFCCWISTNQNNSFPCAGGARAPRRTVRHRGSLALPCVAPASPPYPLLALARSPRSDHIALVAPQAYGLRRAFENVEYVDEWAPAIRYAPSRVRAECPWTWMSPRGGMIGCQDVNGSAKSDEYNAIRSITAKGKD